MERKRIALDLLGPTVLDKKQELNFNPSAKAICCAIIIILVFIIITATSRHYARASSRVFLSAIFQIITPKTAFAMISATE